MIWIVVLAIYLGGLVTMYLVHKYAELQKLVRTLKEAVPAKALGYPECNADSVGYRCSCQRGHAGDHVARLNHVGEVVKVWARSSEKERAVVVHLVADPNLPPNLAKAIVEAHDVIMKQEIERASKRALGPPPAPRRDPRDRDFA